MVEKRKAPSKGVLAKVCTFFKSGLFLEQCEKAKKHVVSAVECLMIDVSVDTKNGVLELQKGVRELLERTDLLADMTQSLEGVRSSVAAIVQGVARLEEGQSEIKEGQHDIKEGQHKIQEGVDLMLGHVDLLPAMKESQDATEQGVGRLERQLQEQGKEEGLFTEVLFQVDPALMGHAQQREKMLSLAGKFAHEYVDHPKIMVHGGVQLSTVGSGEIQAGLCLNPSSCMIWSSQGCGWVSGSCPIKNVFDELKRQLLAKTLSLQVVVVCHTYGARETAQQLRDAGVPVVVSINRALMQLDGAVATKLLFDVIHPVIAEIVKENAGDVAQVQNKLHSLLGKHLPGVSRLRSDVLGVPVRVKNSRQSGTVFNELKLKTGSNLTSSGEKARKQQKKLAKELQLAVCDVPYPSVLVDRMVQALGEGEGRGGVWHIKGKGDTPFFRGRAVVFEASMSCLVNDTFAVVWRIETVADTVSLDVALEKHGAEGCSILVWIDVTEKAGPAEWADIGKWLTDRLLDVDDYRVVLLLTSGESKEMQDAALQLSTQLKFDEFWISDVKDASSSLVKAHALHEDLRLSFREETEQCSPFDLLDEKTLAELVAKALPGLVSGDGSEGAQQDVPIAGMYLDGRDLIVTICVRDISFLKNLSHAVLTGTLDMNIGRTVSLLLQSGAGGGVMISGGNMGQPIEIAGPRTITVESDMTNFAVNFEHAILAMDKLTAHQDEKKDAVLRADDVHLFAPAGAGKTFVALHCIELALSQNPNNKILFVVKNEALALYVVKWICARFEGAVAKRSMLERLHLLYQPCEDGPRAVELEEGRLSTKNAKVEKYDMIVVDEAHHVYSDASVRGAVEKYTVPLRALPRPTPPPGAPPLGFPRFLILSDISQSFDLEPPFPADLSEVYLTEVVRSSQRIHAGAAAFQLDAKHKVETTCKNDTPGPPLKTVMFPSPPYFERFPTYAANFVKALVDHVVTTFAGLSLDDRVAVVVPDQPFLERFRPCLEGGRLEELLSARLKLLERKWSAGSKLQQERLEKMRGVLAGNFRIVTAAEASRYVPERGGAKAGKPMIVFRLSLFQVDTVENFHGLERLIAIAVGLDEASSAAATIQSRARLYCAMTRAQLFVVVVNEFLQGGCLEFLGHVELREDGKMDTGEVDRTAAGALIDKKKKQMAEGKPRGKLPFLRKPVSAAGTADAQGIGGVAGSANAQKQTGGTGKTESQGSAEKQANLKKAAEKKAAPKVKNSIWDTSGNGTLEATGQPEFMPFGGEKKAEETLSGQADQVLNRDKDIF
ncbi:hypothetical protein T484DRAFT_1922702 [Baffinella frigidus]|nr:hypothetical protein T484DRAFT_1922702 [Cryptophyta sp. CCMP2293]